ncbi:MAG: HEAT repeat domain-containing protein [Planctomycetes bacterium]|nr:HEAT repeat domain-containing protein [Planctomycetota bacterium]
MRLGVFAVPVFALLACGLTSSEPPPQPPAAPAYDGRPVADWSARLAARDVGERVQAARVMAWLGPAARASVPGLLALLEDADWRVRHEAAAALARVGAGTEAVPATGRLLTGADPALRFLAAEVLRRVDAPEAVAALRRALQAPSPDVRKLAAKTLAAMGARAAEALPELLVAAREREASVRAAALRALGRIGPAGLASAVAGGRPDPMPVLFDALRSGQEPEVRRAAAGAIRALAPPARSAAPVLLDLLRESDDDLLAPVLSALCSMSASARQLLLDIDQALQGLSADARREVFERLGRHWPTAELLAVGDCLREPNVRVRIAAARVTATCCAPVIGLRVLPFSRDGDPTVRRAACLAMAAQGEPRDYVLREAVGALDDAEPLVRECARESLIHAAFADRNRERTFLALLQDAPESSRESIRDLLDAMARRPLDTLARVRSRLSSPQALVRRLALLGMAELGYPARAYLAELEACLSYADAGVRAEAARALAGLWRHATPSVPTLLRALKDPSPEVRGIAAAVLGSVQDRSGAVKAALVDALRDDDAAVRVECACSLVDQSTWPSAAIPVLIEGLRLTEDHYVDSAALLLPLFGRGALPPLAAMLAHRDPARRRRAATLLGNCLVYVFWTCGEYLPRLAEALRDPEAPVRREAARALGKLGRRARGTAPALAAAVVDPDERVRAAASFALARVQPGSPEAIPGICAALRGAQVMHEDEPWDFFPALDASLKGRLRTALADPTTGAFPSAAYEYDLADRASEQFVTDLLLGLRNPEGSARVEAARELGRSARGSGGVPDMLSVRPAFELLLEDNDAEVTRAAADALAEMGPPTAAAIPALRSVMRHPDSLASRSAQQVLAKAGAAGRDAAPELLLALPDGGRGPDAAAWQALQGIYPGCAKVPGLLLEDARRAGPRTFADVLERLAELDTQASAELQAVLFEAIADPDREVRAKAARGLAECARSSPKTFPVLLGLLGDADPSVRRGARSALSKIPDDPRAFDALVQAIRDPDPDVREESCWLVSHVGKRGVEYLKEALRDPEERVRLAAFKALAWGPDTAEMIPRFVAELRDPEPCRRKAAAEALGRAARTDASPDTIQALVQALDDPSNPVARAAANALEQCGGAARHVVPELLSIEFEIGAKYFCSHARRGKGRAIVFSGFEPGLASADPDEREGALVRLLWLGKDAPVEASRLLPSLSDPAPQVRLAAAYAMANLGKVPASAVPALVKWLEEGDAPHREAAVHALGGVGQDGAAAALQALEAAAKVHPEFSEDVNEVVRRLPPK